MSEAPAYKPGLWGSMSEVIGRFIGDDAFTLAGALAYYTALSLAPLLTLVIWATRLLPANMREHLTQRITNSMGEQAGQFIGSVMHNAQTPGASVAGAVSFVILMVSATAVFAQLQWSMNQIWDVQPRSDAGVWDWLRRRLLSLGMILAILFLLLVAMIISMALSTLANLAGDAVPGSTILWQVVNGVVSAAIFVALFAAMFKFLPDVKIPWKDTWVGAVVTAVLFTVGKYLIGLYIGHSGFQSSYGAAGSLIALLVWVYYSSLILFIGAEVTQVRARRVGTRIEPDEHAERTAEAA